MIVLLWIIVAYTITIIITFPFIILEYRNWDEKEQEEAMFHIVNYRIVAIFTAITPFYNLLVGYCGLRTWYRLKIATILLKKLISKIRKRQGDPEIRKKLEEIVESLIENSSLKE